MEGMEGMAGMQAMQESQELTDARAERERSQAALDASRRQAVAERDLVQTTRALREQIMQWRPK